MVQKVSRLQEVDQCSVPCLVYRPCRPDFSRRFVAKAVDLNDYHSPDSYREVKSSCPRVFSLNFQASSFILHLLMEVFPFMVYHPLEPVNPCFEDRYTGFSSDVVENVSDRAFQALLVRDVVFDEFSLDITKEEVTWCEVRAVSRARYQLDFFV
jgi:hypothetical protein